MTIIIISGNAGQNAKQNYVKDLAVKMPNAVYLNINHLREVFSQPATSEFTEKYTPEQRIDLPCHAALFKVAQDNLLLNKEVILDGDLNLKMLSNEMIKSFHVEQNQTIFIVNLQSNDDSTLMQTIRINRFKHGQTFSLKKPSNDQDANIHTLLTNINNPTSDETQREGMLIMSAGLGGSGKTTLLKATCPIIIGSAYLDKDSVAMPFLDIVNEGMPSPYYNIHVKSQSYATIFKFAADNLQLHKTTFVDGCFGDRLTSPLISNHLATTPYVTTLIYFQCSGEMQLKNIIARGAQRDTEKLADMKEDRRINIQKHLKDFSQINSSSSVLYINTEKREIDFSRNIERIIYFVLYTRLITLAMNPRTVDYQDQSCVITQEEAQGGMPDFLMLLARTIKNDQLVIAQATPKAEKFYLVDRNTIWGERAALANNKFGLKLPSGGSYQWPNHTLDQDIAKQENWRHKRQGR